MLLLHDKLFCLWVPFKPMPGGVTKISLGLIVAPSKFPMIQKTNQSSKNLSTNNFPFFTNLLINWWKLRWWNHWLGFWLGSWSNRWREWHPGQRTRISRRECLWIQLKNHLTYWNIIRMGSLEISNTSSAICCEKTLWVESHHEYDSQTGWHQQE